MKVVSGPVNPKNIFTSGAPTIGVIDLVNPDEFKEDDIIGSEVGESISDFINKYAAKRQVFVNADGKGNIVIDRGATELLPTKLIYRKLSPGSIKSAINTRENNMLSVSLDRSYEDRFNKYVVLTQKNPNALLETGSAVSASEVVEQKGSATDSTMRTSRTFVILDDSDSKETADKRAIWEANIRRARSLDYSCDVQGYKISSDSDVIWSPNKLVIVEDEINSISSQMLIKSVTYSFNENGSITTLNLGYPDSFTLQAEQTVRESRTNKIDTEGLL
jgi:prophage tail gpP-like protein